MLLRDKLLARLAEMGDTPDHQRLTAEILGIRGASPDLARRLIAQALVVEDRRESWRRVGERICAEAPASPGVYVLRDETGRPLYVGKAVNLRRRLRAHFARRRWRAVKAELSRAQSAEWREVGSELEALLREAELIHEVQPAVNIQIAQPSLDTRAVPDALVRDVIVVVPSVEEDSVELIAARVDGGYFIQRTRRNGADLAVHATRLMRFFKSILRRPMVRLRRPMVRLKPDATYEARGSESACLAPIVFSWLAGRGTSVTRLDPHDVRSPRELRMKLRALLQDEQLFVDRIEQRLRP